MRAVIWTDVFQSFVMVAGLIVTAVIGVSKVGSLREVFEPAIQMGRLTLNFNPNPSELHSFWGVLIGLSFNVLVTWTVSQPTVQRVIAARTEKDAKRALYASFFGVFAIILLLVLDAFIIFATYWKCDLIHSKQITQNDQILPYFVVNKLGYLPGIPGLFTACIYSFALSTISSGLNGISALFLEDVVKKLKPDISDSMEMWVSRIVAILAGIFVTGFSFIVPKLGKYVLKIALGFFGIIGGPYFVLFALGIFTETANAKGASIGALIGLFTGFFFSIGSLICPAYIDLPPISIQSCANFTITNTTTGIIYPHGPPTNPKCGGVFAKIVSISYTWHGAVSIIPAFVIGYLISAYTKDKDMPRPDKALLYNWRGNFLWRFFGGTSNVPYTKEDEEKCDGPHRSSQTLHTMAQESTTSF